jgi:formylglycine-generating enzyme required for sulfatase activity
VPRPAKLVRALAFAGISVVLVAGAYGGYQFWRIDRPKYSLDDDPRCPAGMAYVQGGVGHLLEDVYVAPNGPVPGMRPVPRVRDVKISAFCMDRNEVTVADYERCVRSGKCPVPKELEKPGRCNYGHAERAYHPINCVSSNDADAYCTLQGKRLPLEEEWEYVAQGGDAHYRYPWGSDDPTNRSCLQRWTKREGTCAVRSYPAEAFGVFDLSGNVREETEFSCTGKPCPEPPDPLRSPKCGGWWDSDDEDTTEQSRTYGGRNAGWSGGGFRCAK